MANQTTINKIVFLFRFISDTGIMPSGVFLSYRPRNMKIVALILIIDFLSKMARKLYKIQETRVMNGRYHHIPSS